MPVLRVSAAITFFTVNIAVGAAATPSFQGLGDLPGGAFDSIAYGVSSNGQVVVGRGNGTNGINPFVWTKAGGMTAITDAGSPSAGAATSSNGSVVVGQTGDQAAFRWTQVTGTVKLGFLGTGSISAASATSSDGSVVVGISISNTDQQAFRWTATGGMIGLGELSTTVTNPFSGANGVSADGSVVVGSSRDANGNLEPFRWTAATGLVSISGGSYGVAYGISGDGSTIIGQFGSTEAFRWTASTGMVGLGQLNYGFPTGSYANGVSADGSVIVGMAGTPAGNQAYIWDAADGMQSLQSVLTADNVNLSGWTLQSANAVSADGTTITGWGTDPAGNREAFVATVPEPTTGLVAAICAMAFSTRRRHRLIPIINK